jgi:hypothetical protein
MAFWKPGTGRPGASSLGGAENGQEDGDDGSLFIFPSSRYTHLCFFSIATR